MEQAPAAEPESSVEPEGAVVDFLSDDESPAAAQLPGSSVKSGPGGAVNLSAFDSDSDAEEGEPMIPARRAVISLPVQPVAVDAAQGKKKAAHHPKLLPPAEMPQLVDSPVSEEKGGSDEEAGGEADEDMEGVSEHDAEDEIYSADDSAAVLEASDSLSSEQAAPESPLSGSLEPMSDRAESPEPESSLAESAEPESPLAESPEPESLVSKIPNPASPVDEITPPGSPSQSQGIAEGSSSEAESEPGDQPHKSPPHQSAEFLAHLTEANPNPSPSPRHRPSTSKPAELASAQQHSEDEDSLAGVSLTPESLSEGASDSDSDGSGESPAAVAVAASASSPQQRLPAHSGRVPEVSSGSSLEATSSGDDEVSPPAASPARGDDEMGDVESSDEERGQVGREVSAAAHLTAQASVGTPAEFGFPAGEINFCPLLRCAQFITLYCLNLLSCFRTFDVSRTYVALQCVGSAS